MQLTEDEVFEKFGKHCGHCNRDTLFPYESEFTCISCGYNVLKRKHELSKIQRKEMNFINRLEFAEEKMFSICVEVYRLWKSNNFD